MKKVIKFLGKAVKFCFIVFFVFVALLFVRPERLPAFLTERLCALVSSEHAVVHCEAVTFGFRHGLTLEGVRVFDPSRHDPLVPVFSAEQIDIHAFPRSVRLVEARLPRLHDGYYDSDKPVEPDGSWLKTFRFPRLPSFALDLERPDILGIAPARVTAAVRPSPKRLEVGQIELTWPDSEATMRLFGFCDIDIGAGTVKGEVRGEALQTHIRPLLETLDVQVALPYMDAFTGVVGPVPAYCGWSVDLATCAFDLNLDLHPSLGRYNGVPLKEVDGKISVKVNFADGRKNYVTTVGPLVTHDRRGGVLDGQVRFIGTNGLDRIEFDAMSSLAKKDTLDVIGYLNGGSLDCLNCESSPTVTVGGTLWPDLDFQSRNDLGGHLAVLEGSLFGIPLRDVHCDYEYVGDTVVFTNATARGTKGGRLAASAALRLPRLVESNSTFSVRVDYRDGQLGELQGPDGIDFGKRYGKIEGEMEISGPFGTNFVAGLNGRGRMKLTDGHIAQMKLFLGLTELLAEHVPGVSAVVNQSDGHAAYEIRNGVLVSDEIVIEGSLFSLKASGSYDMVKDNLDFVVQVRFLKDENLLGKYLIRPILWPFSKLLMEFRVSGKIEEPQWKYITILDRVL